MGNNGASPGGPFEFALSQYNERQFESARARFDELSELGLPEAQRNLAVMLVKGEGGKRDLAMSYALLAAAAKQGDSQATPLLPRVDALIKTEDERARAQALAEQWISERTLDAVMRELEPKYSNPSDAKEPKTYGIKISDMRRVEPTYPTLMARRGIEGTTQLQFLIPAHGHPRDFRLVASTNPEFTAATVAALSQWTIQVEKTKTSRLYSQVINYRLGGGSAFADAAARRVGELERDAQSGDETAMYRLGWALATLPVDDKALTESQSLRWLYAAARAGIRDAAFDVHTRLREGSGCTRDTELAAKWANLAAALGQPDALRKVSQQRFRAGAVQEAIFYVRGTVSSGGRPTDIARLAWMLATIDIDSEREGQRALDLIDSVESTYLDRAAWHEIRAAALANTGQWDAAKKEQLKALRTLARLNIPREDAKQRLNHYKAEEPLRLPANSTPF